MALTGTMELRKLPENRSTENLTKAGTYHRIWEGYLLSRYRISCRAFTSSIRRHVQLIGGSLWFIISRPAWLKTLRDALTYWATGNPMPYAMSATFETQPVVLGTTDWFVIDGGTGKGADTRVEDGVCEWGWSVDEARTFAVGAGCDDTAVVSGAKECERTDWLVEVEVADANAELPRRKSFFRGFFIFDVRPMQLGA
jgi:hypothetical protein